MSKAVLTNLSSFLSVMYVDTSGTLKFLYVSTFDILEVTGALFNLKSFSLSDHLNNL